MPKRNEKESEIRQMIADPKVPLPHVYQKKENRDAKAIELQVRGYVVRRAHFHNQQFNPQNLEDGVVASKDYRGNRTLFSVLYTVQIVG